MPVPATMIILVAVAAAILIAIPYIKDPQCKEDESEDDPKEGPKDGGDAG